MNLAKLQTQALELQRNGRVAEAERLFLKVLKAKPTDFVSVYSLGVIAAQARDTLKAFGYFDRAVKVNPKFGPGWYSRGLLLQELLRYDEAMESYDRALQIDPADHQSLYCKGVLAMTRGDAVSALQFTEQSLQINSASPTAWYNRGVILQALKRREQALESFDQALKLNARYVDALVNRGAVLQELYRHGEALQNYAYLLEIDPRNEKALGNSGIIMGEMNRHEEAVEIFRRLLQVNSDYEYAWGLLYFAQLYICDWHQLDSYLPHISEGVALGKRSCKPLALLGMSDSPPDHLRCARIFVEHWAPPRQDVQPCGTYRHDKVRVAYVSPDLREHPVGHLMAGILERHDKSRFVTIGISLDKDDNSRLQKRIAATFDHYVDAHQMSSREIAELMRSLEVDIAVDLAGYTANCRSDIFTYRPAPVQVNYLGFPGTTGSSAMDYILADPHVLPEADREHFSEQVAYLPHTYLPTDRNLAVAERTPSRQECGLPEEGFVFCSFNHSYKITPQVFEVWMRILEKTPGSVLWLMKLHATAQQNLQKEAKARGIDPARLLFATRVPLVEDHLARYRLADLFLDTTPYNAHTTASDALFVGLPVLTCRGNAFPGRVAGSLLNAIGLPELIADSLPEYERLAVTLAHDPALLQGLKGKLQANRATHPLFDTDGFCRNLESAYLAMWERHQKGEPPASFRVA